MVALVIDSSQRSHLRKQTHHLKTVVYINERSDENAIFMEVDRQLQAHELIKIRISEKESDKRLAWANKICEHLSAALIQHVGQTVFVYRPTSEATMQHEKAPKNHASDEYIPKKLAAAGKTLREFKKRKISEPSLSDSPRERYLAGMSTDRSPRPTTHKKKTISARAGAKATINKRSAFSLKTNRRK